MDVYLQALYHSIEHHAKNLANNYTIRTLYLGGGTPNLLSPAQLEGILNIVSRHYTFTEHPEITIEINPEFSSDRKSLKTLSEIGFTRLSIGIQSLNDAELAILGRIHSRETALRCLEYAREIFSNLSADVIYSIPGQTPDSLHATLDMLMRFAPEHISAYNLTCEAGTPFAALVQEGKLQLTDDETERGFFLFVHHYLLTHGYKHYEISNYAKPEYASRHNSAYWSGQNYLGLGPSAHSKLDNIRYAYQADIQTFISEPCHFHEQEEVTDADTLITRLRTDTGLQKNSVAPEVWQKVLNYAKVHSEWFRLNSDRITCTLEGWLFLDSILVDLI